MCSIFGAVGRNINYNVFETLRKSAGDRGRDGGRCEHYDLSHSRTALLGNWRATPTPEVEQAPLQPYDGVVHNGTVANDKELGGVEGEVDSMVLPRILWRTTLAEFATSVAQIRGSYAIAVATPETVFLACNYKPIHYWCDSDGTIFFSSMERHFRDIVGPFERPRKMAPYSVLDLSTGESRQLTREDSRRVVVIASTGLDSTVVATQLVRAKWDVHLLHFLYGCRAEEQEALRVKRIADALRCSWSFVPLNFSATIGAKSTITTGTDDAIGKPREGAEYAIDWVPARNLVMLGLATAFAESHGYHAIALGNNLEEAGSYPDNEEEFTTLYNGLLPYATQNGYKVEMLTPVGHLMKREIVQLGLEIGAPFEHTWSCYRGREVHCGACGPCFMRREAFKRAGVKDPVFVTEWSEPYWDGCKGYETV
jgi:7-cyano-7-deazaguanine synthase